MTLQEYLEPLSYDIAFWLAGVTDPASPLEGLGALAQEVSYKLRAAAVIVLLTKGDADGFYHNLIRSGRVRETYLRRVAAAGRLDDHHYASGRYGGFTDAVAAGEWVLAGRIAAASPPDFRDGHEYEDDYCYAQILHRLATPAPPEDEIARFIERFEAYLDGDPSPRFDLCKALAQTDQAAFDAAFEDLLAQRDNEIAAAKARGQVEEPPVVALRMVYVEGLAVLRLAEARGLQTEPDYRFCPALARAPMVKPFPGE
jgi:hypothetical protein